jgi:5-methylcytosine-specific restriction endonuclease McrA
LRPLQPAVAQSHPPAWAVVAMIFDQYEYHEIQKGGCTCGSLDGYIKPNNGQDTVWCNNCGKYQYNASRELTGRAVRSKRKRPNIKVGKRARILLRDSARCVICHHADRPIEVGHLISEAEGEALGMTDDELIHEDNLAAMCDSCNSGLGSMSINPRILIGLIRARIYRDARRAEGGAA